ncbi:MAG: alpha/beta fold hydrolase, partial [Bermanella sp.]
MKTGNPSSLSDTQPNVEQFDVNGRTYSALVAGEGPTVLCLHGFPDTYHSFRKQVPALVAQGYRVVCPVMPGYEESSLKADNRYSIDYVSDEIIALTRAVSRDPVHLVGHDWGAITGYAAAAKAPELF